MMAVDAHEAGLAMMLRSLSKAAKSTLLHAIQNDRRIIYGTRKDQCLNAMADRGLTEWHNQVGTRYGRSYWWITDAGMEQAKQLLAAHTAGDCGGKP